MGCVWVYMEKVELRYWWEHSERLGMVFRIQLLQAPIMLYSIAIRLFTSIETTVLGTLRWKCCKHGNLEQPLRSRCVIDEAEDVF